MRQLVTTTCCKRAVHCTCTSVKTTKYAKNHEQYELDEVAVTVLAKVLGAQVRQLILALDVVDADLALLHQFLDKKMPQRGVLCARTVGTIAGDVQHRRVVVIQRHAAEA